MTVDPFPKLTVDDEQKLAGRKYVALASKAQASAKLEDTIAGMAWGWFINLFSGAPQ